MKRDNDHFRRLLLEIESSGASVHKHYMNYDLSEEQEKDNYHLDLLADAGFLKKIGDNNFRMSNEGHDFLDAIRDEGIWRETKGAVAKAGGSVALEIVKAIAMGFLKTKIEKHTGIEL